MRMMLTLAATPAAFFLPSQSKHINIGKLALIGMIVTTFFLFTAGYVFPGGAAHYPNWAEAIVHGTKLPPSLAQREVGFPLLYILGGFTFTHSFIGITLILAVFAVLMGILVYWSLEPVSASVAYYTGLICILSLAPITYLKFFYPDQAYIFFNLLSVVFLIKFIQSKDKYRFLYLFTLIALTASFTRTAGNLMFPVLLAIAYFSVRGHLRHYAACILIFAIGAGLYQWHRYEIFDMRHQASVPSGKGMQILYSTYLYLGDFGLHLSPDIGPNTNRLFTRMREELGTNVRTSPLIQKDLGGSPKEFMEKYFYVYTPEQLIEKISTAPNEEYYWNVIMGVDTNDQFFLNVAKEIMRAHPWYVVQYSMRNFRHALFSPGYATTRYNTVGYIYTGNQFIPAECSWGVYSADPVDGFGQRAVKEMQYFPLKTAPGFIQSLFAKIRIFYLTYFDRFVLISSLFIVIAWLAGLLGLLARFFPNKKFFQYLKKIGIDQLTPAIIAASALVVYEALMTSLFCQPVYRYFHLIEPLRLIVAGFGLAFIVSMLASFRIGKAMLFLTSRFTSVVQRYDWISSYFSDRRRKWVMLLIGLNVILFSSWVVSMLIHTS